MIGFKTNKERDQYAELGTKNPKLLDLLIDLSSHVSDMFKKDIILTSVFRTPDEQTELYKNSAVKAPVSAHSVWKAVDLRSFTFTQQEIDYICSYLNKKYKNSNGKPTAFCHAIPGGAPHFHIQLLD